ncbi:uncharacterized protein AMSG_01037 [Thecamonas trahens ATCC 50062]|uniref:Cupin n=1 Tax=Thecamonas trahens ATCC 50062 TaxID=461836 RepID=A0A0L0DIK7_THETB|nr:hypothetical protein AMSG_01037 [Thecamonas trahens ATCC 50062]KNC52209.1 hypothetical protein AMSG_01037 [Thecamonas trahens ATCC 50062]|eukprot:XP_013762212.1 hypothetical protein AMSG_01037 [Thecamonas trahens ATCC 50062]
MAFFTETLGMVLVRVYPADDPATAVVAGHGVTVRLQRGADGMAGTMVLRVADPDAVADGERAILAPNGCRIRLEHAAPPLVVPPVLPELVVTRAGATDAWGVGRAGMAYRDLIPSRLGGAVIASHIRIPGGGEVPDSVHFHDVSFQLIYCYRGWVEVVYEDQGPPFRLTAGACVIQPPLIRHRVLRASSDLEVIELGVPAEHMTTIDHDLTLPTSAHLPKRRFSGQAFVHFTPSQAVWAPARIPGLAACDTGVAAATLGKASVSIVAHPAVGDRVTSTPRLHHSADILFTFVLDGSLTLSTPSRTDSLAAGDAFLVPAGMPSSLCDLSDDLQLLEVALPGVFDSEAVV